MAPNLSAVNMGPYYSNLGAAQAAIRFGAKGTLVVVSPELPGFDRSNKGAVEYAETQGLKGVSLPVDVPLRDPDDLARKLVRMAGRIATDALLSIRGEITKESVNRAFRSVKNFRSDLFCKPWYYDSTVGENVSNNTGLTVAPVNGKLVEVEACFEIAVLPDNPLAQNREEEQELWLNTGGKGH